MLRKLAILFAFIKFISSMPIIEHSCNFVKTDTCVRIDTSRTLSYTNMKAECEKYELQLLSPLKNDMGTLRKVLFFRYPTITHALTNRQVNSAAERVQLESDSGLTFGKSETDNGNVVYNYDDNKLYILPENKKLPVICWGKFKARLQCPPNFKLYRDEKRTSCFHMDPATGNNEQCKKRCLNMKSNLGSFHSFEERVFFAKNYEKVGRVWVGTRFPAYMNMDKSTNREAAIKSAYNMDGSIWEPYDKAFAPNEPNGSGQENCIEMWVWGAYSYNDNHCTKFTEPKCFCEAAPDQTNVQY
uniref:C-type lectin domain-containing protein n=1 Tax=Panagrellus redivivus TaxID=6233 RepID=A0A7E4USU1_PANRE